MRKPTARESIASTVILVNFFFQWLLIYAFMGLFEEKQSHQVNESHMIMPSMTICGQFAQATLEQLCLLGAACGFGVNDHSDVYQGFDVVTQVCDAPKNATANGELAYYIGETGGQTGGEFAKISRDLQNTRLKMAAFTMMFFPAVIMPVLFFFAKNLWRQYRLLENRLARCFHYAGREFGLLGKAVARFLVLGLYFLLQWGLNVLMLSGFRRNDDFGFGNLDQHLTISDTVCSQQMTPEARQICMGGADAGFARNLGDVLYVKSPDCSPMNTTEYCYGDTDGAMAAMTFAMFLEGLSGLDLSAAAIAVVYMLSMDLLTLAVSACWDRWGASMFSQDHSENDESYHEVPPAAGSTYT